MGNEQTSGRKLKRFSWRKFYFGARMVCWIYVGSYFLNSFFGGYWLITERDGCRWLNGVFDLDSAIMWQPLFGHLAVGNYNFVGQFYSPLIYADRQLIHPSIDLFGANGFKDATSLSVSKVHPEFRDDFVSDVKVTSVCNVTNQTIQCSLRLIGSDRPRSICDIRIRREGAQKWGISPPDGFVEKPFDVNQKYETKNYIRWSGKVSLQRDHDVILKFLFTNFSTNAARIFFRCDLDGQAEVNHTKICSVKIGDEIVSSPQK